MLKVARLEEKTRVTTTQNTARFDNGIDLAQVSSLESSGVGLSTP